MPPPTELSDSPILVTPPPADDAAPADRAAIIAFLRDEMRLIRPALPPTWPDAALLRADLALDSLDLVELVARAEQHCCVFIGDEDLPRLVSLDAMADYLCARAAA